MCSLRNFRSVKSKLVVIVGPTASGKSELAVRLAEEFDGEVISADSRQVYRGMDIGSGKIIAREMRGVPHHLLDVASPKRTFTAVRYQKLAREAIRDIVRRGKLPVVCGGTAFYIDALIYDYDLPAVPPQRALRKELERLSVSALYNRLMLADPERAKDVDPSNKRRVIRALEVVSVTGEPVPRIKKDSKYNVLKMGIRREPKELHERIEKRLTARLRGGMVAEVQRLHEEGLSWDRLDGFGLEYRYVSRYVRKLISKEEMIRKILQESLGYARRQMSWWRKDTSIHWVSRYADALRLTASFLA
jgi:tRNA dimethylallyltransferase